ncbi:MAG TPA: hypothetical protein DIC53_00005, partial [Synergistaceae bacterium]|nr:hypothetical protein [Synergistaceae bacterium]
GRFTDLTWEEFVERGTHYSPSRLIRQAFGAGAGNTLSDGERDLFLWFRKSLTEGLRSKGIANERITIVILSGG